MVDKNGVLLEKEKNSGKICANVRRLKFCEMTFELVWLLPDAPHAASTYTPERLLVISDAKQSILTYLFMNGFAYSFFFLTCIISLFFYVFYPNLYYEFSCFL